MNNQIRTLQFAYNSKSKEYGWQEVRGGQTRDFVTPQEGDKLMNVPAHSKELRLCPLPKDLCIVSEPVGDDPMFSGIVNRLYTVGKI